MAGKILPRPPHYHGNSALPRPVIPLGLDALYAVCRHIYPDQPNPLQVIASDKYWLGGPDPLDYISMYFNPGNPASDIPPHWHYVSFGLSDLHGDGRVHGISGYDTPSGFGFELTFRLKKELDERVPPTWPALIMQALAKYVFQSENTLCYGDNISWHCPLDESDSRMKHMLMCEDPQLSTVQTPFGPVTFIQIVGVCVEELQAAQGWNGPGIIKLMKSVKGAGGPWLITDMRRSKTIFELDLTAQKAVDQGVETNGSSLSGVSAKCSWQEKGPAAFEPMELIQPKFLGSVHVQLNLQAGAILPFVLRGRLKHGRHFTFKSVIGDAVITLVPISVTGAFVDAEHPFAAHGSWLQILLTEGEIDIILSDLNELDSAVLPKTFEWVAKKLSVTMHKDYQ